MHICKTQQKWYHDQRFHLEKTINFRRQKDVYSTIKNQFIVLAVLLRGV